MELIVPPPLQRAVHAGITYPPIPETVRPRAPTGSRLTSPVPPDWHQAPGSRHQARRLVQRGPSVQWLLCSVSLTQSTRGHRGEQSRAELASVVGRVAASPRVPAYPRPARPSEVGEVR